MARGGGVEQQLRVDDILVAVGIQRANRNTTAKLEVDDMHGGANADEQVTSTKRVGDGWKDDATLEIIRSLRREEPIHINVDRRQGVLNIVACDRVVADGFAAEAFEILGLVDEMGHRCVERRAAFRIRRGPAQLRWHLFNKSDTAGTTQNPVRNRTAKR